MQLAKSGDITLEVMTYEKSKETVKKSQLTSHIKLRKKEHASSFRDALTQYLTGLIS